MDGMIIINKEKGFTSHDVVAKMRGILHMKKIGHTGTLDPDATGVLPVCIGKGTRACSLLEEQDKTYRSVLLLGVETDTQDISGKILQEKPVEVTGEQVRAAFSSFHGKIRQIPPMYSALKVNGKRLYEYAREGKEIERQARTVEIHELVVEKTDLPRVTFTVTCSKGTYVRTLCHDIGQLLGCGGCMEELVRLRVGSFRLEDAITLGELEERRDREELESCILTLEELFSDLPGACVDGAGDVLVHNGNRVRETMLKTETSGKDQRVRMYDSNGVFVGIYEYVPDRKDYKPLKMFL